MDTANSVLVDHLFRLGACFPCGWALRSRDIPIWIDHKEPSRPFIDGPALIEETCGGLRFAATLRANDLGDEIEHLARRGRLGVSPRFRLNGVEDRQIAGRKLQFILDAVLVELSVTTDPATPGTRVQAFA